tara:strand:+ start:124 stop:312 length:189 start_codon:yes stop_codon:yes gene_type:complete
MNKKIPNKYKSVQALSFTTGKELVISFDGFEDEADLRDFADFVFAKIKMRYSHAPDGPPTYH